MWCPGAYSQASKQDLRFSYGAENGKLTHEFGAFRIESLADLDTGLGFDKLAFSFKTVLLSYFASKCGPF